VLYLAANGDPARSAAHPRLDLELNTVAFVNFLERWPADRVVFMSSGAVYDGLAGPVTPATPVNPMLPYAISKLASERYLAFFAERRQALASYASIRFFGAYGPHEAPRKITTRWLRAVMTGEREFRIRGDGRNLIDFIRGRCDRRDAPRRGRHVVRRTLDLASGAPVTIDDIAAAMARALGVDVAVRHEGHVPSTSNSEAPIRRCAPGSASRRPWRSTKASGGCAISSSVNRMPINPRSLTERELHDTSRKSKATIPRSPGSSATFTKCTAPRCWRGSPASTAVTSSKSGAARG
jgi:nucleoside-diphosphate-sugar epimerase